MGAPVIQVTNLVKKYGDFTAVNGISFSVQAGEIFGLLGPNGAGKTTTLEIIETLREKTSGAVFVDGLNLDKDAHEIKSRIGVQLQSAGYYPNLNLKQLIALFAGLYNRKVSPLELLDTVALREKAGSKYKELSGGQKQRFSIARRSSISRKSSSWTSQRRALTPRPDAISGILSGKFATAAPRSS